MSVGAGLFIAFLPYFMAAFLPPRTLPSEHLTFLAKVIVAQHAVNHNPLYLIFGGMAAIAIAYILRGAKRSEGA